jgi:hypothetical protein
MVALTNDEWTSDLKVKRSGYIAAYEVSNIEISPDETVHSFDLTRRVVEAA